MSNYAIYRPSGKAQEYAEWACNFYVGCTGKCSYCYLRKGIGAKVKATENAISSGLVDRLAPSSFNKYMDYTTQVENFMVTWIERIHRTAEKQLDWTRTLVSYAKEEMRLSH